MAKQKYIKSLNKKHLTDRDIYSIEDIPTINKSKIVKKTKMKER